MIKKDSKTAAEVRGRIQSGDSGDIRSGFDPAAAPLETDAEAAGQPMNPEEIETALHTQNWGAADRQRNYDVAMREPGSAGTIPQTTRSNPLRIFITTLALVALAVAIASWIYS
ncbi:conserved hypothetical protein (plasmid) [Rhizobium leguminosarum bv. trifolii WSM1325]|uniref:Uncharacterized protein n=1 Tax=Rhizobium leguminosarum bv. trifolii (strain WSM1325) TaxID=395491 RepID=C6B8L8_RHILS|nr:hypothetical protein [Rhizobium leguminosarum]ACS60256.1 conserved hypothetical protein [Rhizobium leguminosarum bv. trifolii WSM1325]